MNFLGIEIGGTKVQVVVGRAGKIAERRRFQVDTAAGADGIRAQIASVLPDLLTQYAPVAVGVGFGGPVDWKTGRIACSHQIAGWQEFPLSEWLMRQTGLLAQVDNDANVAALGEYLLGAGVPADPFFYMTLGSGVGGGFIANGEIFHGAVPGEAEVGHLRLDREGTTLESRCSGWAVDRRIREARATRPESLLFQLIGDEKRSEARHLAAAFVRGDPLAAEIIQTTAEDIAFALSHVTHLVHPEVIVLGGGLSLIGEQLRSAVTEALTSFLMDGFRPGPRIMLSSLGEDAVPAGALLLAETAGSALGCCEQLEKI